MTRSRINAARGLVAALTLGSLVSAQPQHSADEGDWRQWGGPSRDFVIRGGSSIRAWDTNGPTRLWSRPIGDEFSAVVTGSGRGFTTYRDGQSDVAIAFDVASGRTAWELRTDAPFYETCSEQLGPVPRATPLVTGRWLFTATAGGKLIAIQRDTGTLAWQRDLFADSPTSLRACGYSSSPIAFGETIIVLAGVPGRSIMALRQRDGAVVWQRHDFANGYSSPTLTEVGGRPELVALMAQLVVGLDPATGGLRWQHPHPTSDDVNVAMPIVGADGLVFLSSGYDGGARALQLSREGDATNVREVWAHKRFRAHFGTVARLKDIVIGSNGDFGPAPFTAVDIKTGQVLWRDRAVARASFVLVGERALILDEDGVLVLAAISATGMVIEARARVLDGVSWTPPTITNDILLLRNRNTLAAFSLR